MRANTIDYYLAALRNAPRSGLTGILYGITVTQWH
jgi:hypothetical protein